MAPHGDRRRYKQRCRCLPCRAANATYVQVRRAGACYPDPSELVDAAYAEMHLTRLKGQGVGYRQAAKLAGLGDRLVKGIRRGRIVRIRADTLTRILSISAVLAHGQTVLGWRTWRLLNSLKREGFTPCDLALKLGQGGPRLQIHPRRLRVETVLKVRMLWGRVNDVGAPESHDDTR